MLLALIGVVSLWLGLPRPAAAHDRLLSSSPASGATVATPPAQVQLKFSAAVLPVGAEVVVKDPSGANRVTGAPSLAGNAVVARLRAGGPAGRYDVAWRVVSQDGHPISGTFSFTATPAAASAPPTSATPTSATSKAVTTDAGSTTSPAASPATTVPPAASDETGSFPGGTTGLAAGAALLAGAAALVVSQQRRRSAVPNQPSTSSENPHER